MSFNKGSYQLFYDSIVIGNLSRSDGLYKLNLDSKQFDSHHVMNVGVKRPLSKENSFLLWHKRLGHISKERINRLIKENVIPCLDNFDHDYVDCVRGKMTKKTNRDSTCSKEVLEIIHTDISGPLKNTLCGNKYFITFIDDFSHYGYVYLINDKSQSLENFKIFKAKVEKQCGKKIKIVRSNYGSEYYSRTGETG